MKSKIEQDPAKRVRGVVEWQDPKTGLRWILKQTSAGMELHRWHSKTRIKVPLDEVIRLLKREPVQVELPLPLSA